MNKIKKLKDKVDSKIFSAAKWSFIGQVTMRLFNLLSTIVLARLLLPEQYGKYVYLIGTLAFLVQLIGFSIRSSSVRNVAFLYSKEKRQCEKYIYTSLFVGFGFSFIGILILYGITMISDTNLIVREYGQSIIYISILAIFSEIFYGLTLGVLEGLKLFKSVNVLTILVTIFKFMFPIIGIYLYGVNGAILGWLLGSFAGIFFVIYYLNNGLKNQGLSIRGINIKDCKSEIYLFGSFSVPSTIEVVVLMFAIWYIQTDILSYGDEGKKEIAVFNIAKQWKTLAIYLPAIFINMLQSFFSGYYGEGNTSKVESLYKNTKKLVNILSILLTVFFLLASDYIIAIFGKGYSEASLVLKILVLPVFLININSLNRHFLLSHGKVWFITLNNIIASIAMITSYFILLKSYDLSIAFAISVIISQVLIFLLNFFYLRMTSIINT